MATKIKLQVNHGKHAKQQSGQKITIPNDKATQQKKQKDQIKQTKPKQTENKGNQAAKDQKDKKNVPTKQEKSPKKDAKDQKKQSPKKQQSPAKKQNKKDSELETLERIKKTQQKTKLTIEELIDQYKNASDDFFTNHGHNQEKQKVINEKLSKLQKQKQERHKKLEQLEQKSLNKSMNKQKKINQKEEEIQEKRRQRRRKRAERKLQSLRILSEERQQRQQKYEDYYNNQYKSKIFRFKKYEEEFKQRQKENEEQIKQKLMKNKEKYKPMDAEQFQQFLDNYEQHKWSMIEESEKKRQFTKQMLENQNRELMAKLWKGECHRRVKQQRQRMLNAKNEGKTKLQKTKQYGTIVKDSFKPKVNQQKRKRSLNLSVALNSFQNQQIEQIQGKKYKKVARQKYVNGVNEGLVIENLRKSLDHKEHVSKGNQYLQFIRGLPKVSKQNTQIIEQKPEENPQQNRRKTPSTTFKPKILKNPYYESPQSERKVSKSAALDQKRIKDPQIFNYMVADLKARTKQMQLEQKAIKYGKYNGILQLQDRHNNLNRKLVQGISQKLQILSKM